MEAEIDNLLTPSNFSHLTTWTGSLDYLMMSPGSNAKYQVSAFISILRCSGVLQQTSTAQGVPATCSGISVRWDYCGDIISCNALVCFLLFRCALCWDMHWWKGKVELHLCPLGIMWAFWSTTVQQSALLYIWLCRLLLFPSTFF